MNNLPLNWNSYTNAPLEMRVSNATQKILANFIPPIASTSLDFDPVWEEIGCQADWSEFFCT
jgi:hypothetical protein